MAEVITPTQVCTTIDKMVLAYRRLWGTSEDSLGIGDGSSTRDALFGASLVSKQLKEIIEGSADPTFALAPLQVYLVPAANSLIAGTNTNKAFAYFYSQLAAAISSACAQSSTVNATINSIETYLSWYNVGNGATYWQALMPPEWRTMAYALFRSYPNSNNVYYPCTQGLEVLAEDSNGELNFTTHTNALYKTTRVASVDTNVAGTIIDPAKFAGGRPYVQWTGGAGSGASTITVTGLDQNGDIETYTLSGTWGIGDFVATQTGATLTPTNNPESLITKVTSVAITGITDAVIYFEARAPLNRSYPTV